MSKLFAIPLFLAGGVGLYLASPGLLRPDSAHPTFAFWLAAPGATGATCILTALCIVAGWINFPRKTMQTTLLVGKGEFLFLPKQTQKEHIQNAIILLLTIAGPAAILAMWLEFTLRPAPLAAHLFATAASLAVAAMTIEIIRRSRTNSRRGNLRIILASASIRLDQKFQIRVESAQESTDLAKFQGRILCFEHILMHLGRFVHVVERQHAEIILPLGAPVDMVIDSIQYPASGKFGAGMYPFYHWEIRIEPKGINHATAFPLRVDRG
jgi:hypothetical protein